MSKDPGMSGDPGLAITRWGMVFLLVGAGMTASAQTYKLAPAMPFIRHDLELGLVTGGWMFSTINAMAMIIGFAAGTIGDYVGLRRMAIWGLVFLGLSSLMGSFAASGLVLLISRIFEGLGFLTSTIALPGLIAAEAGDRDRRLALSLWGCYMPAGATLTLLIAPYFLETLGWRALWQIITLLTFLLALRMIAYKPQFEARHVQDGRMMTGLLHNVKTTLAAPGPRLMAACFALYTFQFMSLMSWMPSFMIEQRGLSIAVAGTLTALAIAVNIVGNLLSGTLLHRGAKHWAILLASAAFMCLSIIGIFSPALPDVMRYMLCLVFSTAGGMLPTAALASVPMISPSRAQLGATNGLIVQGASVGTLAGPPTIAAVAVHLGGWDMVRWPMVVACCLIAILVFRIRRIESRTV